MDFLNAASLYVGLGWKVLPLKPGSKEPWAGSRGVLDATNGTDAITRWASDCDNSNIGIACGKSGLMVVDLDPRHGCWKRVADWEREGRLFPPTVYSETRSGGLHLYFACPEGLPEGWKRKLPGGVDIQVGNKYVVAPPSVIDPAKANDGIGGAYRWKRAPLGPDLPRPPPWLLSLLKPPPLAKTMGKHAPGSTDRRVEGALRRVAEAAEGTRNDELNKQAHFLGLLSASGGLRVELAEVLLTEAALASGLPPVEVRKTVRSGLRAGVRHAAQK